MFRRRHPPRLSFVPAVAAGVALALLLLASAVQAQTGSGGEGGGNGLGGGAGSATGPGSPGLDGAANFDGGGGGGAGTTGGNGGNGGGGVGSGAGAAAAGGAGGAGGTGTAASTGGGGAGGGAHGVVFTASSNNAAAISGGTGGTGGAGATGFFGGGGGGGEGGFGVVVNGTGLTFTNSGSVTGGLGGAGGSGTGGGSAGGGGDGGHAVFLTGASTLVNSGMITGGTGGASGAGVFSQGGAGGAGVVGSGSTLVNSGTITGGNGGIIGAFPLSVTGPGGPGVIGSGITITNSGIISGGLSGTGVRTNVITFSGGTNLLNELAGANLIGNLTIGTGTTLTGTGTSTMTGAFTQTAGGTYQVNTAGGTATHIVITGTATLGGNVVVNGTGTAGTTFTILRASGGLGGTTFAGVTDNVPFTTAQLTYDPNDVFLVLIGTASNMSSLGQTFNQRSTATALGTGALAVQVMGLPPGQVSLALDQLSGEIYASNVSAGLENQSLFLRTLAERLRQSLCLCGTDAAVPGCEIDDAWHTWGTPFGQAGTTTGNGNAHGFDYDSVGFAAGADRWLTGDTLIGLALGYDNWENNTNLIGSRSDVDSFLLGLYTYQQIGNGWLLGTVSYENDSYDTTRPIDFLGATARSNASGNQVGSYLEAGYSIGMGGLQVQPIGSLQYISLWRDGLSEAGAGAADLNVAGTRADSFRSSLGGRVTYPLNVAGRCVLPEARAFWVHDYAADTRDISTTFAGGGPAFLAYGQNIGRDWGQLGLGLSAQLRDRLRVGIQYDAVVNDHMTANGGMAQVQWNW